MIKFILAIFYPFFINVLYEDIALDWQCFCGEINLFLNEAEKYDLNCNAKNNGSKYSVT